MIISYLYVGVYMLYGLVDCEMIANNTFTVTAATALGDGIWQAIALCNTVFPYKTYSAHGAWMVSRFGVPITNYKDYLSGVIIDTDPDGKWIVTSIRFGSGGGSLNYALQFDYDLWLGSEVPSGDCHQFTNQLEAETFANNAPDLSDTPADTLIDTDSLKLDYTGHSGSQGSCHFSFPGIAVGAREAVILAAFNVPVNYLSDYIGNTVLHAAGDGTWYIVKDTFHHVSYASYIVNFQFTSSNTDLSTAFCSMYVSEADAVIAASFIDATTTNAATTTNPATTGVLHLIPRPTAMSSLTNTVPVSTVTSNPSIPVSTVTSNTSPLGSVIPIIVPHTSRSNKTSGYFAESQEMRNKYVYDNNLWKNAGINVVQCVRLCLADDTCVSVFHHADTATCTGHQVVYGSGNSVSGVLYYVFS